RSFNVVILRRWPQRTLFGIFRKSLRALPWTSGSGSLCVEISQHQSVLDVGPCTGGRSAFHEGMSMEARERVAYRRPRLWLWSSHVSARASNRDHLRRAG